MRQAGRYLPEYRAIRARVPSFLELCYDPDLATEVTLQPVRRFGMDAAILFSDILVIPDALGQEVRFEEKVGPVLGAIRTADNLAGLNAEGIGDRLRPVYEAIRRVRDALPSQTALIGFAGAPWTVASYMVEGGTSRTFEHVTGWAERSPSEFGLLIEMLVDATATHLITQAQNGVEAVQIFDTWASVLTDPAFAQWCLRPIGQIIERFRAAHPQVPVIVFVRGPQERYLTLARELAPDALSIETGVDPKWAGRVLQPHCAIQGNLDPKLLVQGGASMEHRVEEILDALGDGPFVFNLGHGIVPETPPDHVARLIEIVRAWRR